MGERAGEPVRAAEPGARRRSTACVRRGGRREQPLAAADVRARRRRAALVAPGDDAAAELVPSRGPVPACGIVVHQRRVVEARGRQELCWGHGAV